MSRVDEIFSTVCDYNGHDGEMCGVCQRAKLELKKVVLESMPINDIDMDSDSQWCRGYEYAIEEMKKSLEACFE